MKATDCTRAVLVGHNAHFDLGFVNAAIKRTGHKRSPFHPFSCFDTVSLAGLALGAAQSGLAHWQVALAMAPAWMALLPLLLWIHKRGIDP